MPTCTSRASVRSLCYAVLVRILVVDDEIDIAHLLWEVFELRGHTVMTAHSGRHALDVAPAFAPDLAIVDVWLPDMSGVMLAEILRGVLAPRPIRIVAFSAWSEQRLRRAVAPDLFDDYICKPGGIERLEQALRLATAA
jgi:DNA-binding response OmpR family regulator